VTVAAFVEDDINFTPKEPLLLVVAAFRVNVPTATLPPATDVGAIDRDATANGLTVTIMVLVTVPIVAETVTV